VSITFSCPHCNTMLKAEDVMAGKTAACPQCNKEINVPDKKDEEQTPQEPKT